VSTPGDIRGGSRIVQRDGMYTLDASPELRAGSVYNSDIAPTRLEERTWGRWHIASLWVGMAICVPTYTLGGVLTSYFGLTVPEALVAILLANVLVLIPLILNAYPGTTWGIPFPVLLRSSFGILGSNVPAVIRALIACGWFGIQTLFGGLAIHLLFSRFVPGWAALGGTGEVIGFGLFWLLNIGIVLRGFDSLKWLEVLSAPLLLAVGLGLLLWAGPIVDWPALLAAPPSRPPGDSLWPWFFGGLTAMVGFWATLSLNIPDFSRFARSQKDQIIGQVVGLPLTMLLFAALGVVLTAASPTLVGRTVSDPITLIGALDSPLWGSLALLVIIVATVSTNTAANIVSPTNDLQNLFPRRINFRRGVLLTGVIGIVLMAWELLRKLGVVVSDVSLESLYSNWLVGYSSLLGPIAGIMVVDYFLLRHQRLDLVELYTADSPLYGRVNGRALLAFLLPVVITLLAKSTGTALWIYNYGWFVGGIGGGALHWLLSARTVGRRMAAHESRS
jgi:NCS1 family nucleobase:cation symporter-1